MQFDFEQFTKRFKRAYPVAEYARRKRNGGSDCGLFAYDDALEVFREYFLAYEYYTGTAHPQLKRERIIDIATPKREKHAHFDVAGLFNIVCRLEYKTRHRALQGLCSALSYSLLSFQAGAPCSFSKSAARLLSVSGSV